MSRPKQKPSKNGKLNPYATTAAAIASGIIKNPTDLAISAAVLGAMGVFDDKPSSGRRSSSGSSFASDEDSDSYAWSAGMDEIEEENKTKSWVAKYADNEDNDKYGIYPEEYLTEDGYLEAIEDAKYSWREECRSEAFWEGLNPDNYETKEEFDKALYESKYGWRRDCEDGSEYGIDPEDYETEIDYNYELDMARYYAERRR